MRANCGEGGQKRHNVSTEVVRCPASQVSVGAWVPEGAGGQPVWTIRDCVVRLTSRVRTKSTVVRSCLVG